MAKPLVPGQRLGAFTLIRELARGGMGAVWVAESEALGRQVAIKVLLENASLQAERRFGIEAEAGARLRHPNVVPVHEIGAHDGQGYLVMDLVEGETLRDRVRREGPLPEEEAARLLIPIARAVAYAHNLGVLHRDLKPANVLVNAEGRPQVTDFGLAKDLRAEDKLTETGTVIGTPAYMAPEQANAEPVDTRADVYALGAILYWLLAGRAPFEGTPFQIVAAVLTKQPKPPSSERHGLSADLEAICLLCLEKDPEHRYPTADAVADDLERFASSEPVAARTIGLGARARRWIRRHRSLAGALAALGTVAVVAVLALAVGQQAPATPTPTPEADPRERIAAFADVLDRGHQQPATTTAIREARKAGATDEELGAVITGRLETGAPSWAQRLQRQGASISSDRDTLDALNTWLHVIPGTEIGKRLRGVLREALTDRIEAAGNGLDAKTLEHALQFEHWVFYEFDPRPLDTPEFYALIGGKHEAKTRLHRLTQLRYGVGESPHVSGHSKLVSASWGAPWPDLAVYARQSRLAKAREWWGKLERPLDNASKQLGTLAKLLEEGHPDLHPQTVHQLLINAEFPHRTFSQEDARIYRGLCSASLEGMLASHATNLDSEFANIAAHVSETTKAIEGDEAALAFVEGLIKRLKARFADAPKWRKHLDSKALAMTLRMPHLYGVTIERGVEAYEVSLSHWRDLMDMDAFNTTLEQYERFLRSRGRAVDAGKVRARHRPQ